MKSTIRVVVIGKVQGVFFRQSTRERALQLGITGWVRNRPDGAVELVARGEQTALDTLRVWLSHGPPQARVDETQCDLLNDDETLTDFIVAR